MRKQHPLWTPNGWRIVSPGKGVIQYSLTLPLGASLSVERKGRGEESELPPFAWKIKAGFLGKTELTPKRFKTAKEAMIAATDIAVKILRAQIRMLTSAKRRIV